MKTGIRGMFSELPQTYERINHFLTLGLDIIWRRKAVQRAVSHGGSRWLDVCSGTGETAVYLKRAARSGVKVNAVDFCLPMLRKLAEKPDSEGIALSVGDAGNLPFPDEVFDLVIISFATRNINTPPENFLNRLQEFHRVLKPGGRFINLETSQPSNRLIRSLFHFYVAVMVKPLGLIISGSRTSYNYLSRTIRGFYTPDELGAIIRRAGFPDVTAHPVFPGIVAIHEAVKSVSPSQP